jgi:di/tricarboxylate transporter
MGWEGWFTIFVTLGCLGMLSISRLPSDAVMLGAMVLLLAAGILDAREALAGFSNAGLITVAALFIVAAGIRTSGGIDRLVTALGTPKGVPGAISRLTLPVAAASAFLNNTPIVAALIPVVERWCRLSRLPPGKLYIPLSYATILGGTVTMIGTSTNLVVNGEYQRLTGQPSFGIFDITPVGLVLAAVGLLYVIVVLPRILPDRRETETAFANPKQYTVEVAVAHDGPLVGRTVAEAGLRGLGRIFLAEIERKGSIVTAVSTEERLQGGDRLVFVGETGAIVDLLRIQGLVASDAGEPVLTRQFPERRIVEAVVSPECEGVGQTIREGRFRDRYGAVVLAVARNGQPIPGNLGSIELRAGDLLLLEARPVFVTRQQGRSDFLLLSDLDADTPKHGRATWSWGILIAVIGLAALEIVDVLPAALMGAAAMIATRCLSFADARRALDIPVLLTIAGSFALGEGLRASGAAGYLATALLDLADGNAVWLLVMTYVVVSLLTEVITNNAAALLVLPIAIAIAGSLALPPEPFVIAVMFAASASFATPIGYQTNLMVYGPGGYRFLDFVRVGLPLNVLAGCATIPAILWLWPFP